MSCRTARGQARTVSNRSVFRARDLGELINALPALFGFPPEDSLVALGTDRARIVFGMRLDLPGPDDIDAVAAHVARQVEHQRVDGVIVVAVGEPLDVGRRLVGAVEAALTTVRSVAGGWANEERFWMSSDDRDSAGHPYRRTLDHPATVQAVWEGHEIAESRDAAAQRVVPVGGERRRWIEGNADEVRRRAAARTAGLTDEEASASIIEAAVRLVDDLCANRPVEDLELLELAQSMIAIDVRDALWALITPENAQVMTRVWLHVARNAVLAWSPAPLCLAAFAAWLSGDGTTSAMAAQQALDTDANYSMADLVLQLASGGVSPAYWGATA